MTPGARLSQLIDLIGQIETTGKPADQVAFQYFRTRRYMGSGDRRFINHHIFGFLRIRGTIIGFIESYKVKPTIRLQVFAYFLKKTTMTLEELESFCGDGLYSPPSLNQEEKAFLQYLPEIKEEILSLEDRLNVPAFLVEPLKSVFEEKFEEEMKALLEEAPLDLRVNTLKASKQEVMTLLDAQSVPFEETKPSPVGLRLKSRTYILESEAYKKGLIEIQDAGSQILPFMCDVHPGMTVLDFCAGAGGKTLGLAALMQNKGKIFACDIDERRLKNAKDRLKRAGVHNTTLHLLEQTGDKWLKRHKSFFDRILLDVPCSGTGTWRRNPDMKWRITPADITRLQKQQQAILEQAETLLKPGGLLIYATCSFLKEENETQIEKFLGEHPTYSLRPFREIWQNVGETVFGDNMHYLRLTPATTKTDGFFVAILKRNET
jgi:16S rRNA (cytosine967-C5)-methyltransferase